MRGKRFLHAVLVSILSLAASPCLSAEPPASKEASKYLNAVREFADNVLKYGRDTYGPKHTPLFVDGLNIHTHEPVKWISPEGESWVLSNLASQQNLFRTLDGLTKITGDPKYPQAAVEAIEYAFANLRTPSGMLYWGGGTAYDAKADKVCGNCNRSRIVVSVAEMALLAADLAFAFSPGRALLLWLRWARKRLGSFF